MSFTVDDVITDVRELIQDTSGTVTTRYSDAFIARKVNQVVRRSVLMRPDLFTQRTTLILASGSLQSAPSDSVRVLDVMSNSAGDAVKEVSQDVLDMMVPTWNSLTAAPPLNWMRFPRDPNRFYVYPKATGGDTIDFMYVKCPAMLSGSDTIPLQDAYYPAIVDGTVWLMESVDAEHVESGRAKMFQESFKEQLTAGLAARRLTDDAGAALPKEEVIE